MRLSLLENSWTLTGVYPLAERHFPGIVFISILAEKKFANNTDKNSKTTCTQIYNLYIKYIYMQPWANTTNQFLFDQTLHWAGQWTNWKRQNGQYGQHGSLLFQFWPTAPLPTYLPFKSSDLVYAFFIPANKLGSLLGFVWAPWLWVCFLFLARGTGTDTDCFWAICPTWLQSRRPLFTCTRHFNRVGSGSDWAGLGQTVKAKRNQVVQGQVGWRRGRFLVETLRLKRSSATKE